MLSIIPLRHFDFCVPCILSSASPFDLDQSKIVSFGKELIKKKSSKAYHGGECRVYMFSGFVTLALTKLSLQSHWLLFSHESAVRGHRK